MRGGDARHKRGLLIVLSGPSGVGKDSIINALIEDDPSLFHSISTTTREPRKGEIEGVSYHFITKNAFSALIDAGDMLEYDLYCDEYYGTPKSLINEKTERGIDVLLDLTVKGALILKENDPNAVLIFLIAPSKEALRARLLARGTEEPELIEQRLKTAERELGYIESFDFLVINDEVQNAVSDVKAIMRAEKRRVARLFVDESESYSV
ncbi:MAG TPA: guanylate kinase [Clostridiaceae bacterium]|nr:guanylate kinase [Clostridiaceae bacterium]